MKKSEIRIVIVDDEPIIRMDLRGNSGIEGLSGRRRSS